MRTTLQDIEDNTRPLGGKLSYDKDFIFDLLAAYGRSQSNLTRLRNGQLNVADDKDNEVAQKGIVYFKPVNSTDDELYTIVDNLKASTITARYSTRFVIVTNYHKLLAIDTKTAEPLDIKIRDIDKYCTFFMPWAGMEKAQYIAESHADRKAAEKMAKLFDILIAYNGYTTADEWHNLTTFFTRLLFCFFAEDTNVFAKKQFINAVASYTQKDGSDLRDFLKVLFASLDDEDKDGYPAHLAAFPWVNGRLFREFTAIPNFNKQARDLLIDASARLDWSDINPDVFGSMFQIVVRQGDRTGLGQHYTSVSNITKTIRPLFLQELENVFKKSYDDTRKLEQLLARISSIKVFDPACGSGNFLIIAYKELRRLEHKILKRQGELGSTNATLLGSRIHIDNFYGIEIDDFAHEVAILSLWLAKHQMNIEFAEKFGIELPLIPLKEAGNIVYGNAAHVDWYDVCPIFPGNEIYLISNPPYAGARRQDDKDKKDMDFVFAPITGRYRNLDYVAIWFYKAAMYVARSDKAAASLVAINSIAQGQQVELLWPLMLENGIKIDYAYTSFKWANNAKNEAKVTCVIVAFSKRKVSDKFIESASARKYVEAIDPYLREQTNGRIIGSRSKPLSNLPQMEFGNMPLDGGALLMNDVEFNDLLERDPGIASFIKRIYGAKEYINNIKRWCIWIEASDVDLALKHEFIKERIDRTRDFRLRSKDKGTRKKAAKPYWFREHKQAKFSSLIIPATSSARREYIPIGYLRSDEIASNLAQVIYDPAPYIFGLISSRMHMVWARAVAGQLKTDFRYSSAIVYNNFPIPQLTLTEEKMVEEKTFAVLDARESHSEKTLAELYDPDKMPDDLRLAHQELDNAVDSIYRNKPFENDEQRLSHLFELYDEMIAQEKEKH